jgi:glyoxylase-like metal-dependent hydrolase (beta-lactamase superfamily II)
MAEWLRDAGVKVDALLLTHQHFDHVVDAARIQQEHGARLFAFAPYSRALTLEQLMEMATGMPVKVAPFRVDEIIEGATHVEVAGERFALQHIPGHSPDSVVFYHADGGLAFSGDVLFAGSIGRTDFPGGSMELLVDGIHRKLFTLPDVTRILPGHGPETTVGEERGSNPFL